MSKLKAKEPVEKTIGHSKGVIWGASGVGKTWFSLDFPAPYFIDTEGGAALSHYQKKLSDACGMYFGHNEGSLDFEAVIDQVKALATEKHNFKTLIIDSITKLYQTAISNEAERLGAKDAFGASKKPAIAFMRRLVNWIQRLDMNVWFICHEGTEWEKNETTGQREEKGKMPDAWEKLSYELDLSLRVIRIGKTYPPTAVVSKSRLTGFTMGDTFKLDYAEFASRYGKDFIEGVVSSIKLATPEQVTELTRLIDLIKVSPEEIEKILTKAKASSFAELSEDQAIKTIDFYNKKLLGKD